VIVVRHSGLTHPGRKRRRNEDAYVVQPPLFAVADGMGGAQAGEIASRLAAEALREGAADGSGQEQLAMLIQTANRRVYERASEDASVSGMGTTMTVALLVRGEVLIGHVGDSRAYLIREGALEQLTQDHSLVGELMRSGKLSQEEAETHPQRSVITRALGTDPDVDVDTITIEARPGDIFLLCSDGLTTMVGDEAILRIVEDRRGDLDAAADALVKTANRGGGDDNITVVFFEIGEDGQETMPLPAAAEQAPPPDDEDTLTELDAVPAVDTMVVPPERVEEVFRDTSGGQTPGRGRSGQRALALIAVAALLAVFVLLLVWGLAR
jgi:PPM family protein phosphatase